MSEHDAEAITRLRRGYEAFNRGDFDAAVEVGAVHPDIEYLPPGGLPPIQGMDQFRAWMEPDAFESQVIRGLPAEEEANALQAAGLEE